MEREQLTARILSFIASEVSEKSVEVTVDTPVEAIKMDSIDVIHVIFKAEEEFDVEIDISQQARFEKVGDFVDELLKFIEKRGERPAAPAQGPRPAAASRRPGAPAVSPSTAKAGERTKAAPRKAAPQKPAGKSEAPAPRLVAKPAKSAGAKAGRTASQAAETSAPAKSVSEGPSRTAKKPAAKTSPVAAPAQVRKAAQKAAVSSAKRPAKKPAKKVVKTS